MPLLRRRCSCTNITLLVLLVVLFTLVLSWNGRKAYLIKLPKTLPSPHNVFEESNNSNDSVYYQAAVLLEDPVACRGADGKDITPGSNIGGESNLGDLPKPTLGSFLELGLDNDWLTAKSRYGPYGIKEDNKVDWKTIDWAALQNECLGRNAVPGAKIIPQKSSRRFRLPTIEEKGYPVLSKHTPARDKKTSGRTAILLRGWDTFEYESEDYYRFRALISETALRYGARYTVFLLVDVGPQEVFSNQAEYFRVLDTVPAEFRNMALLFNADLLKSWYPKLLEYGPQLQNEQIRQLFAHLYQEFDHYWQVELDVRFTGHVGKAISALETFARNEPRKQARERSSFTFVQTIYQTYANLTLLVDKSLNKSSSFYGGVRIPDIVSIGPQPPGPPEADKFQWGVGEEADLILLSPTWNVTLDDTWHWRDWIYGFELGNSTPRIASAGGMSRCSWNLLNQMHEAQVWQGLRVPSEASAPSFALWHNLKISRPPLPIYMHTGQKYTPQEFNLYYNGGLPAQDQDGMGYGEKYYGVMVKHNSPVNEPGPTWAGNLNYPRNMYKMWLRADAKAANTVAALRFLMPLRYNWGELYMPNLIFFPIRPLDQVIPLFNGKTG